MAGKVTKIGPFEERELVWIDCPHPIAANGLAHVLQDKARVHLGERPPQEEKPSAVVYGVGAVEGLGRGIERIQRSCPGVPILVFGLHLDLPIARAALKSGARGVLHADMPPEQVRRAFEVALRGEVVVPRDLVLYMIGKENNVDLDVLSARQREVVELLEEGLTNDQIAERLFLHKSTVKNHLRFAYQALGVSNRSQAARLLRVGAA